MVPGNINKKMRLDEMVQSQLFNQLEVSANGTITGAVKLEDFPSYTRANSSDKLLCKCLEFLAEQGASHGAVLGMLALLVRESSEKFTAVASALEKANEALAKLAKNSQVQLSVPTTVTDTRTSRKVTDPDMRVLKNVAYDYVRVPPPAPSPPHPSLVHAELPCVLCVHVVQLIRSDKPVTITKADLGYCMRKKWIARYCMAAYGDDHEEKCNELVAKFKAEGKKIKSRGNNYSLHCAYVRMTCVCRCVWHVTGCAVCLCCACVTATTLKRVGNCTRVGFPERCWATTLRSVSARQTGP